MTIEEANVEMVKAEIEKAKAHARLMNAQAEKLEREFQASDTI